MWTNCILKFIIRTHYNNYMPTNLNTDQKTKEVCDCITVSSLLTHIKAFQSKTILR